MELKLDYQFVGDNAEQGSNRTFMELKFDYKGYQKAVCESSNRTFMELKLRTRRDRKSKKPVLIAPLWN